LELIISWVNINCSFQVWGRRGGGKPQPDNL